MIGKHNMPCFRSTVTTLETLIKNFNNAAEQQMTDNAARTLLKDGIKNFLGDVFAWYCGVELAIPQSVIDRLNATSMFVLLSTVSALRFQALMLCALSSKVIEACIGEYRWQLNR
jgi:hypothetical protein